VRHAASVRPSDWILASSSLAQPMMALSRRGAASFGSSVRYTSRTFSCEPRAERLVVRVTDTQPQQHPLVAAFIETFGTREQQLSDPIQRIGLATTMSERLVLHAAAHLVETAVRDPHHMERIRDAGRVIEMRRPSRSEALGELGGDDLDPGQPSRVGLRGPSPQISRCVAFDHVDHDPFAQVDETGRVDRRVLRIRPQERGLIDAELAHGTHAVGIIASGVACSITAFITVQHSNTRRTNPRRSRGSVRVHRPDGTPPSRPVR
jgi:hypothetical protein